MVDKTLSTIIGSGDGFITKFVSGVITLASGASGDVVTLTPPANQKVKLTGLVSATTEPGVTVTLGGSDVVTSLQLVSSDSQSTGDFSINATKSGVGQLSSIEAITGDEDEQLVIKKDTGSTVANITYTYQFGQ